MELTLTTSPVGLVAEDEIATLVEGACVILYLYVPFGSVENENATSINGACVILNL